MASKLAQNHAQMAGHKVIGLQPSLVRCKAREGWLQTIKPQSKRNLNFLASTSFFSHSHILILGLTLYLLKLPSY